MAFEKKIEYNVLLLIFYKPKVDNSVEYFTLGNSFVPKKSQTGKTNTIENSFLCFSYVLFSAYNQPLFRK